MEKVQSAADSGVAVRVDFRGLVELLFLNQTRVEEEVGQGGAPEQLHRAAAYEDLALAGADVEINVRERFDTEVITGGVRLDLRGELQEQAEFTDFHRLFHDVHSIEVVQNDGFQDAVPAVGVRGHVGEDLGEFLVIVGVKFLPCLAPLREERFHAVQAGFVEWLKDVQRGKNERTRAARGIEDSDGGDGLPEGHEQVRAFAALDDNCLAAFEKSGHANDWRELMRLFMVRRTRSFVERNYALTECPACATVLLPTQDNCPKCERLKAKEDRRFLILEGGSRFHFPKRQPKTLTFRIHEKDPDDQYARLYSDKVVDTVRLLHLPRYGLANYLKPTLDTPPSKVEAEIMTNLSRAGKRLIGLASPRAPVAACTSGSRTTPPT